MINYVACCFADRLLVSIVYGVSLHTGKCFSADIVEIAVAIELRHLSHFYIAPIFCLFLGCSFVIVVRIDASCFDLCAIGSSSYCLLVF